MKKIYMNPEMVVIALAQADIVTASIESEKDQELWQPGGEDKDWSQYLNVN